DAARPRTTLRLFDGFELRRGGRPLVVAENAQRLVAFLAIAGKPQRRSIVAGSLWMDTTDERASANLRTALWKIRKLDESIVECAGELLSLSSQIRIDTRAALDQVQRVLSRDPELSDVDSNWSTLTGELLPMWDDGWIVFERERLRQLCIHGLEALATRLSALGRHAEAVDVGLSAVSADPLRETAQRALICAHLAEGNMAEARRQFERYRVVLADSLGIEPSSSLEELVFGVAPSRARSRTSRVQM